MPSPYVFTQWFTFGSNGSNAAVDNLAAVDNMFTPVLEGGGGAPGIY